MKRIRLLISGSKRSFVLSSFLIPYFDSSIDVELIRFHDEFNERMKYFFFRVLYYFFPRTIVRRMDNNFVRQAEEFRPDCVVVFKGLEISARSLKTLRKQGVTLINYNLDHPFEFESRGSGNRFVKGAIPFYDLHITYSKHIERQLKENYQVETALLPFGFQVSNSEYSRIVHADILRVCFVGNPDRKRAAVIQFLANEGVPMDVYGKSWDRFLKPNTNVKIHDQVLGFEYLETLAKYRVQLNILRNQNFDSHNMRTFEIPSVGGVMLAEKTAEQEFFFKPGEEAFFYDGFDDLRHQCAELLAMSASEIRRVRQSAREKSIKEDYSYQRRAGDLVRLIRMATSKKWERLA